MGCYSIEGVNSSSSGGDYPNIPDFSQMRVNESKTPANVCKYCYKAFMECGCSKNGALGICANIAAESGFKPDVITWDGSTKSGQFGIGGGLCGFYRFGALPELAQHAKKPSIADIEKLDNGCKTIYKTFAKKRESETKRSLTSIVKNSDLYKNTNQLFKNAFSDTFIWKAPSEYLFVILPRRIIFAFKLFFIMFSKILDIILKLR